MLMLLLQLACCFAAADSVTEAGAGTAAGAGTGAAAGNAAGAGTAAGAGHPQLSSQVNQRLPFQIVGLGPLFVRLSLGGIP